MNLLLYLKTKGAPSSNKPSSLNDLRGWVDYVWTGSFFHLFSLEQQIIVAKKLFSLIVSKENGAKVLQERKISLRTSVGFPP